MKRLEKIAGAPSRYVPSKENEATATTKIMTITTKTERQSIKNNIIKTVNWKCEINSKLNVCLLQRTKIDGEAFLLWLLSVMIIMIHGSSISIFYAALLLRSHFCRSLFVQKPKFGLKWMKESLSTFSFFSWLVFSTVWLNLKWQHRIISRFQKSQWTYFGIKHEFE